MKDLSMYLLFLPVVLLLGGIGVALRYFKAYGLINGYRSMDDEQKKKVDIEGQARFLGLCLLVGDGIGLAGLALLALGVTWAGVTLLVLLVPGLIYMVARAQKFDGNAVNEDGKMNKRTKLTIVMLVIVMGGLGVGVFAMFQSGQSAVAYNVTADKLEINCAFGAKVDRKDIEGLTLADTRPDITARTFGSAIGEKLRGSFSLKGGKAAKVYVENAQPPFIEFSVGKKMYILNCATPEKTRALYEKLK